MKAFQLTFQYSITNPDPKEIIRKTKRVSTSPTFGSVMASLGTLEHFRCTKGESDFWQNTYTFTYAVKLYQIFNDFHGHKVRWLNFTSHQLNLTNLYMIFNAAVCQNSLISINFQMKNKFCKFCFFVWRLNWILLLFTILDARYSAQLQSCLPSVRKKSQN